MHKHQVHAPDSCPATVAFNSLFEMRYNSTHAGRIWLRKTFNSLFEMQQLLVLLLFWTATRLLSILYLRCVRLYFRLRYDEKSDFQFSI